MRDQQAHGPARASSALMRTTGRGSCRLTLLLSLAALTPRLQVAAAAECGQLVFAQGFAHRAGAYQDWTQALAAADFGSGSGANMAQDALGSDGQGFGNVRVGEARMRVRMPAGALFRPGPLPFGS